MVLLSQANDCFCGAFIGIRHQVKAAATKPNPFAHPPPQLPTSTELPAKLAAELRAASGGSGRQCAVAGVAGPVVAALLGAADGLGYDDRQRERLHVACRRELRQLARAVGPQAGTPTSWTLTDQKEADTLAGPRVDTFDVLVAWCSTPAVPTYGMGVQLALGLGDQDASMHKKLADLAWVFRLLCARARVQDGREAPMLFAASEALCGEGGKREGLEDAMATGIRLNRSVSLAAGSYAGKENAAPSDGGQARGKTEAFEGLNGPSRHHSTVF